MKNEDGGPFCHESDHGSSESGGGMGHMMHCTLLLTETIEIRGPWSSAGESERLVCISDIVTALDPISPEKIVTWRIQIDFRGREHERAAVQLGYRPRNILHHETWSPDAQMPLILEGGNMSACLACSAANRGRAYITKPLRLTQRLSILR